LTAPEIRHTRRADLAQELTGLRQSYRDLGLCLSQARTEIELLKALVREQDHQITQLRATHPDLKSAREVQVAARKALA